MPGNVLTATIKVNTQGVKAAFDETAQAASKANVALKNVGTSGTFDGVTASAKKAEVALNDTDKIVQDVVGSSKDLNDALNKLGSQGLLSINAIENSIKDFRDAFRNATNPADIKRFGDGLKALEARQRELINAGLGVEAVNKRVAASHGANVVATQRLSSSVLGLANIFNALPPELSHLTHGFDQVLQSYERISHGSQSAGESVKKFAAALGGVGLGLAISIAAGFVANFITELIEMSKSFTEAERSAAAFRKELEEIDRSIKEIGVISDFTAQVEKLQAQIKFGSGFKANIIGDEAEIKNNAEKVALLTENIDKLIEGFQKVKNLAPLRGLSDKAKELVSDLFPTGENIDKGLLNSLKESDKEFVTQLSETNEKIRKLQDDRQALQLKSDLLQQDILLQKADEARRNLKAAFEQIKAGFVEGLNDVVRTVDLNPSTLSVPFQLIIDENKLTIQFSALNEQLRAKLKQFELRASSVPIVIKQQIEIDPNLIIPAGLRKEMEEELRSQFPSDVPLKFEINAEGELKAKIDVKNVLRELQRAIANATSVFANETVANIGTALGDAISKGDIGESFKAFGLILANALSSIGKAMIAAGVKILLAKQAISKLFANPALSIAAGIALIALSRALQNTIGGREKGGPVQKGKLYEVNERGREIFQTNSGKPYLITGGRQFFTPPVSGKIIPHHQTEKILNSFKTTKVNSTRVMNSVSNSIKNFSGYRAGGGAVVAGNSYIVNERGREIFIPNTGQSINVPQPTTGLRNGGISINLTGGVEISGNKLIAVLANAQRNQKVFV